MQQQILFHKIFGKTENDWDTDSFLKNTVEQYPYFGLANFYALKNTLPHENNYAETAVKTAFFFNNSFFLQTQLLADEMEKVEVDESTVIKVVELVSPITITDTNQTTDNIFTTENDIVPENNVEKVAETFQPIEEKTAKVEKEEMLFEPLFASDYFASQGIKLSEAILTDDKLGKQLKSFTSWLKTMKKVHPDKLAPVSAIVETAVQNLAEKSNIEAEIVTEAMAEAFAQQGKNIRAIDTYKKLSLLDPAKSAYFATKIETLK